MARWLGARAGATFTSRPRVLIRAERIVAFLYSRRRHARTIEVARGLGIRPDNARRALQALERCDIVTGYDEPGMTVRWRLADRVVVCPKCRHDFAAHAIVRANRSFDWRCPPEPDRERPRRTTKRPGRP